MECVIAWRIGWCVDGNTINRFDRKTIFGLCQAPGRKLLYSIALGPWSDIDYSIRVITQQEKTKTEDEDNDDYGSATKIALGTRITGNIQSDSDVDFYKFILKKRTNVKVTFTHNPAQ